MYWICLSDKELDDTISALYLASQCDMTFHSEAEAYGAVQEKLEFFREHENQEYSERAPWQFTARFTGNSDLPTGGESFQSFKERLRKRKEGYN